MFKIISIIGLLTIAFQCNVNGHPLFLSGSTSGGTSTDGTGGNVSNLINQLITHKVNFLSNLLRGLSNNNNPPNTSPNNPHNNPHNNPPNNPPNTATEPNARPVENNDGIPDNALNKSPDTKIILTEQGGGGVKNSNAIPIAVNDHTGDVVIKENFIPNNSPIKSTGNDISLIEESGGSGSNTDDPPASIESIPRPTDDKRLSENMPLITPIIIESSTGTLTHPPLVVTPKPESETISEIATEKISETIPEPSSKPILETTSEIITKAVPEITSTAIGGYEYVDPIKSNVQLNPAVAVTASVTGGYVYSEPTDASASRFSDISESNKETDSNIPAEGSTSIPLIRNRIESCGDKLPGHPIPSMWLECPE